MSINRAPKDSIAAATCEAFTAELRAQLRRTAFPPEEVFASAAIGPTGVKVRVTPENLVEWVAGVAIPTLEQIACLGEIISAADLYRTRYPAAKLLGASDGYTSTNPEDVSLLFAQRLREVAGDEWPRALLDSTPISEHSLDQYARGETTPPLDVLAMLANAFHVHPAWLGGLSEAQHGATQTVTGSPC